MGIENRVLVLASGNDPQLAMLTNLLHTVCGEAATCSDGAGCDRDPAVVGDPRVAARSVFDL